MEAVHVLQSCACAAKPVVQVSMPTVLSCCLYCAGASRFLEKKVPSCSCFDLSLIAAIPMTQLFVPEIDGSL